MKKSLVRYSEILKISSKEFEQRGILNPSINGDTLLFIDPKLLKTSELELFNKEALNAYENYYKIVAQCVKKIIKTENSSTKEK